MLLKGESVFSLKEKITTFLTFKLPTSS